MSMITGKIAKGVGGLYTVISREGTCFECSARGIFRKDKIKPLVGDEVLIQITDVIQKKATIEEISNRRNEMIRPEVANVDLVVLVFSMKFPTPSLNLLDRFLVALEEKQIPVCICFNKTDLSNQEQQNSLREIYQPTGYPLMFFSVRDKEGLLQLKNLLNGKTSVLAGTSGVGKSSLMNELCKNASMETGELSKKIERGKNTTRHSELFCIGKDTFLMDTPGFSSFYLNKIEPEQLYHFFPEMKEEEKRCRFSGCSHMEEPDCGVKQAVTEGKIAKQRYESYRLFYQELKQKKRY